MMRSVQRILAVFESFTTERNTLALQEIADRIGIINQGKLLCVGTVSDIMRRDGAVTGTLEDVFLELTKGDEVA